MVLNDEMLKGLRIYDVTCLIHFDIPSAKPGGAVDRFSCMWMNFRDIANEKVDRTVKFHRKVLVIIALCYIAFYMSLKND